MDTTADPETRVTETYRTVTLAGGKVFYVGELLLDGKPIKGSTWNGCAWLCERTDTPFNREAVHRDMAWLKAKYIKEVLNEQTA